MSPVYDIAIVGSGFAGSLLAMIARRMGRSVVLLERGRHPRVVIGESSTPLSNLLLEDMAARYDLPRLKPLAKWGSWQQSYPELACGLKRGFTFYHHELGRPSMPDPNRARQLLVAASPHDGISDTHWYRADFDQFLMNEARSLGVDYMDEVRLDRFAELENEAVLSGEMAGQPVEFRARFVVDATGPRGFLSRALKLPEVALPDYPLTQSLYSHFSGVKRIDELHSHAAEQPPYPADDAAVHHVFDGGWIWVLRFNNGITSAGLAATDKLATRLSLSDGADAWTRLLHLLPTVAEQFSKAAPVRPFTWMPRLSYLSGAISGNRWALLPSAAGFVDPLLSTGFPLTLLGVGRLAEVLEQDWETLRFNSQLERYAVQTMDELLATSRLTAALYANMNNFSMFTAISLLYFAAASYSETAQRLKKPHLAPSFLLHNRPGFGHACRRLLGEARRAPAAQRAHTLADEILKTIEPIDVAGLTNPDRRNWYPVEAEDLLRSAAKIESSREELIELLDRSGFYPAAPVLG